MRFQSLGQEDSPGEGNGNPLQYARVDNPMARGAWWAIQPIASQSRTRLRWLSTHVFPWWLSGKECALQCRRCGFDPLCQEDPLEQGNGYPLQYSCLENSMEPGRLQSKGLQSQTRLSEHTGTHSMWDLSSLTREDPVFPALEVRRLNSWSTREVPCLTHLSKYSSPKMNSFSTYE